MLNLINGDNKVGHFVGTAWTASQSLVACAGDACAYELRESYDEDRNDDGVIFICKLLKVGDRDDVAPSIDPFDPGEHVACVYPHAPRVVSASRSGREYQPCVTTYLSLKDAAEVLRDEPDPADTETSFANI